MANTIEQQLFDELTSELPVDDENKYSNKLFIEYLLTKHRDEFTSPEFAQYIKDYSIFL